MYSVYIYIYVYAHPPRSTFPCFSALPPFPAFPLPLFILLCSSTFSCFSAALLYWATPVWNRFFVICD